MENNLLSRTWFAWVMGVAGVLLVLFLIVEVAYKTKETSELYRHASYPQKTLNVNADGKTKALPDTAYLSFTITGNGKDNNEAQADADKQIKDFTEFLTGQGVDRADINVTQSYSTPPPVLYQSPISEQVPPTMSGAQTSVTISVQIKGQEKLSDRITAILDGAQKKNIISGGGGSCLTFEDTEKYLGPAREQALQKARQKAEKIAEISGFKMGKLVSVSDSYQPYSFSPAYGGGSCAVVPVAHMEITPQELTDTVNASFEIK